MVVFFVVEVGITFIHKAIIILIAIAVAARSLNVSWKTFEF